METVMPDCYKCIHKIEFGADCKAFPSGIPSDIFTNKVKHTKPYKGDNGIMFEPKKADK